MGKSSKQKNKKIDKRKKRSALKKKAATQTKIRRAAIAKEERASRERKLKYPNFHYEKYDEESVSVEFVNEVKQILNNLDFNDSFFFNPQDKEFLKQMKINGFDTVIQHLMNVIPDKKDLIYHHNVFLIGSIVFEKLKKKKILENFIPYNDVDIVPQGYDFAVIFNGMLWEKTKWGRVHYSPKKPKISIDGKEYIVAFSNHAIERICDRCAKNWTMYAGAGDAFAFLNRYSKFEIVKTTHNDETQYFLGLYDRCEKGFANYAYVTEILKEYESNKKYYYRVGYCPVGFSDDFASAKTLLIPGMKGTPEYFKMKDSNLKFSDKKRYEKLAGSILKNEFYIDSSDWDAVRWYHENGIPQVVELEEDPFGY